MSADQREASSIGEQVAQGHAFGQLQQRLPVLLVGPGKALLPAPDDVAIGYATLLRFQALACNRFAGVRTFRFMLLQWVGAPRLAIPSELRPIPSEPDIASSMSQAVSKWPRLKSSASFSSAAWCRKLGRTPYFHHRRTVRGSTPRRRAISAHVRPDSSLSSFSRSGKSSGKR